MSTDILVASLRKNTAVAAEMKAVLADLIPQMVRYNSVLFAGATDEVIGRELQASSSLTKELYVLAEALDVEPQKTPRKKGPMPTPAPVEPKPEPVPAPTPIDPDNTPQPREDLPEHAASTVGEPNDSDKEDAK